MALSVTFTGVHNSVIRIQRDEGNVITSNVDYLLEDAGGIVPWINSQVYVEQAAFADLPIEVRQAMATLNNYYEAQIIAERKI